MAATYTLPTTTLARAIAPGDTNFPVASVANIVPGVWIVSVSEAMQVSGVDVAALPYPRVTVQRGVGGSFAVDQAANTTVYIGTPDKFYQKDPVGVPASPALVSPWINTSMADGGVSMWVVNGAGTAWIPASGFAGGDVVGPSSSTDNAVARFDGTTGTLIQNSVVIVDDSGNTSGVGTLGAVGPITLNAQTVLLSEAANTLALRNGTNGQVFNIYKTYTSATNLEALQIDVTTNTFQILSVKGSGGGTSRDFYIGTTGSGLTGLKTNNTLRWYVDGSGHFVANADNTYDIGASGATRPRTGYFGTSVVSPVVNATTKFQQNGTDGVTAGPYTAITSITVKGGIITAITGS